MKFIHKILALMASMVAAMVVTGCDVHEFPETLEAPEVDFVLHLNFDREMPPYKDIIYETDGSRAENPSELYDVRYIINIYRSTNGSAFTRQPDSTIVVTKDEVDKLNYDLPLALQPGKYQFMVWTDYCPDGTTDNLYYDPSEFASITIRGPHIGNTDYRDAFRGLEQTMILEETTDVTVYLQRPMGKYRFIATDFERFLNRAEAALLAQWEASRGEEASDGGSRIPEVDLNDYRVVIRYPGFMPHVFNMYTNRPADAKTGVSFEGKIYRLSDTEAELGFDYVLVNGDEAPVSVAVEIYDKEGKLLGSSGSITVPLMRSMLTTVRGEFLTAKASGGVGVSPEFDGEFNIIIK